MFLLAMD